MWFKNLTLFRLTQPFTLTPETLAEALEHKELRPCGSLEPFTYGWTSPLGKSGTELVHAASGCILICARKEERLLPASVVREEVESRIAKIEQLEARPVHGKEKRRIRDDVTFDLLPRAFTRSTDTEAYLSPSDGWLVINTAVPKRAEDFLTLLGQSLGSFEVAPLTSEYAPTSTMTYWLSGRPLPKGFSLQNDCELRDRADETCIVRCQHQDLGSDEVQGHIHAHKEVHQLGLGFEDRLSFILRADLSISRLRFDSLDEFDAIDEGDEVTRFDANFAYMTTELKNLLEQLGETFMDTLESDPTTRQFTADRPLPSTPPNTA
jgi:recombination associated protein RdgC